MLTSKYISSKSPRSRQKKINADRKERLVNFSRFHNNMRTPYGRRSLDSLKNKIISDVENINKTLRQNKNKKEQNKTKKMIDTIEKMQKTLFKRKSKKKKNKRYRKNNIEMRSKNASEKHITRIQNANNRTRKNK